MKGGTFFEIKKLLVERFKWNMFYTHSEGNFIIKLKNFNTED